MVLIITDEGGIREDVLRVVGNNVVKGGSNFECLIKVSMAGSTVIDGDRNFNLAQGFLPSMRP